MWFRRTKEYLSLELVEAMKIKELFGRSIEKLKKNNQNIDLMLKSPLMVKTAAHIHKLFEAGPCELAMASAYLHSALFTKKELRGMIRFYKYGPGKVYIENLPELEEGTVAITTIWVSNTLVEIGAMAEEELEESKKAVTNLEIANAQASVPDKTKLH